MRLTPATNKSVERELPKNLNRWLRKYPAYTVKRSGYSTQDTRIEMMHEDIGFLLQVLNTAMQQGADMGPKPVVAV